VRGALHVSGLQVEQPVTVLAGRKLLSGILQTRINVQGKGLQWAALAPSLSGNGSVSLTEGVVHGVQIVPAEASSHLRQESQVKRLDKAARQQRFDSLTGTFDIVSGRVTNNDMKLTSYDLSGTGAGWADLPSGTVNYQARLHVTGLPVIPVSITGPLAAPSYGLDVAGFTGNILKGVGNLLKKPADTGIETLEDVGGLLRQMFGRPASK
jgi:AsmA protein